MAMDEALRLDYLDAMGVTQYVARSPLPGARPSPVLQPAHSEPEQPEPIASKPARISELLDHEPPRARPSPEQGPAAVAAPPDVDSTSPPFQCQLAIWTADDLLVLADMPRLDNLQKTLLRNILQAIGRDASLPGALQYKWPIPQNRERNLQAARDHFQGLLDGGPLQSTTVRQILCFGPAAATLLASHDDDLPSLVYREWPVTAACALQDMLDEPACKADTWRKLQVLVRH